ncbi:PEP-CTERM sorting domain-containing protein [Dapis sp. BLCC M126]|uniref:PEP-CTERM sorting domain-containing protein n=1 Tax=Dapis sp. BLCC M126 TaxID=3400189 RepID=UPI003CF5621B
MLKNLSIAAASLTVTILTLGAAPAHASEAVSVPEPASILGIVSAGALGAATLKRKQEEK